MTNFHDYTIKLLSLTSELSKDKIHKTYLLKTLSYTNENILLVEELVKSNDISHLKNLSDDSNNVQDSLFIYKIETVAGKEYISLIVDPFELYHNTYVLRIIEIYRTLSMP